ncbi:uncharacterized protein GGS22DRAFT_153752 [Annulohypoxylon maeteangense]|uniref:uncharacterized protein n=1 Tax=Annulohypoxylon maeteangense TaxID=1927788 RepID=UPI0020086897|nr:uncharacterized protein GGS22DRAFT_153752 [Annulohypoxylon maeteangense]KAI0889379.1 hypothetical protein GGS22DRAFT_153752 [Annulohypoxylon maeteangense]
MFMTFKPLESEPGNGHYVLESTASPLNRPPHRISRSACVYCRSKKVKCTGEEDGCRRCSDKQIACSYTSPSRTGIDMVPKRLPRLRRVAKDAEGDVLSLGDDIATPPGGLEQSSDVEITPAWDSIIIDPDLLGIDFDLTPSDTTRDKQSAYTNSSSLFFDGFQASDDTTVTTTTPISTNQSPLMHVANRLSTDDIAFPLNPSPIPSPNHSHSLCLEMLHVFEVVEIRLTWTHHTISNPSTCTVNPRTPPLSTSNDEFICQKEVLSSCDKWLNQDASYIQSRHAVLMISIMDRLLASILLMAEIPEGRKGVDTQATTISPDRSFSYESRQPSRDQLVSSVEAGHSLQPDHQSMNDEERIHVFKSLLNFRASRLRGLLEGLRAITALNRWQMQTNMVQHLLDRLSKHCDLL